ncbi:NAD/NADP transhydrogenase alpha subunit-like protein [Niveispirillum irakense]|uniref:NAD/NADP transhydrogenase alpha subunit-like protein n=1 Tax=Niveispirillum irakense TaxID=34011 RepID=UPI0003F667E8|nr:NAD/NADP transhydrogenase alpha subunit-like protein [Niveispirillum irakense]
MRSLCLAVDAMGVSLPVTNPADTIYAILLTAGVPKSIAVPTGARVALFSATGHFWLRLGGAAMVPNQDILDGSAPELNPVGRQVAGIADIGLAAASDCIVNIVFYG